jgi:hypothetical protein
MKETSWQIKNDEEVKKFFTKFAKFLAKVKISLNYLSNAISMILLKQA